MSTFRKAARVTVSSDEDRVLNCWNRLIADSGFNESDFVICYFEKPEQTFEYNNELLAVLRQQIQLHNYSHSLNVDWFLRYRDNAVNKQETALNNNWEAVIKTGDVFDMYVIDKER